MSLAVLTGENDRIDTFSIVPHAQSKLLIVIADFNLNLSCLGVLERVPQRFGSDPVDLVTKNRMQISRLALNCYWNPGRWLVESVASSSPSVLMASARSLL